MNLLDRNATIGSVVAELPQATDIFKDFNIDFCCGGHRKLADVIAEQGINETEIYERIRLAQEVRKSEYESNKNFNEMNSLALSSYIEDTHHSYLRRALPDIAEILNTILRVHGKNHMELFEVYRLFGGLKTDLEQHLLKEETMLFPALYQDYKNQHEILHLSSDIIGEHEAAGKILEKLRTATNDYKVPDDACGTYERAYAMLEELEKDLHQHIHLENNILLKDYDPR